MPSCRYRFQHSFYITSVIWNYLNNPYSATISLASWETLGKKEFQYCLIGLASIWDNRIFAGWHTIKRHQCIQSFSSLKETRHFPNSHNFIPPQVYFDLILLGNARLTNFLAMSVHQILVPHFFLLFQCFNTFAAPDFSTQHSKLLMTSNRWQSEIKFL